MVVLKKIKAATLMETLIATVLIVVVFMVASLTLNNVFSNTTQRDKQIVEVHVRELHYLYLHHQLEMPYEESYKEWLITLEKNEGVIKVLYKNIQNKKEYRHQFEIIK